VFESNGGYEDSYELCGCSDRIAEVTSCGPECEPPFFFFKKKKKACIGDFRE
jgi:hypothetical protein